MTAGEEKTVLKLSSILKYTLMKKLILGALCLYFYLDPSWFPEGISAIALLVIVGIDLSVDFIVTGIMFGIIGIRQEVRVRKGRS